MIKTYYLAKILSKLHLSSFKKCDIDRSAKIDSHCVLAYTKIERYSYVGAKTCITGTDIGKFCSIGSGCQIGGGVHPLNLVSTSPAFLRGKNILSKNFADIDYNSYSRVVIGNDVWIGDGSYIKSGITIGNGAVIGAHAVVTHDVGEYEIVAGSPAKVIRKRFSENEIDIVNSLEWWNWTDEKLYAYGDCFISPEKLHAAVKENERK